MAPFRCRLMPAGVITVAMVSLSVNIALGGDLRPSTVTPPIVVVPQAQTPARVPDDAFYRDFAQRAENLTPQERAQLATNLREQALTAKNAGRFAESAHFFRLLDAVEKRK